MSLEVTALTSYITVVTNQDDTVTVTTQNPSPSQTAILFEDEGAALGTRGTVNEISFVGSGVTATRSGDKVTVTVSSGGGGGTWGSITGTLSSQTDLQNELDKKILYLSATGTNTYTAAYSLAAYTTGQTFAVIFANANTGAATLNVNSLGAKSIVKRGSTALIGNDIIANESYILFYDGTNFQLIGRAAPFSDANPIIKNAADYTKQVVLSAAGITTGTTRTYTMQDRDGTIADTIKSVISGSAKNRFYGNQKVAGNPTAVAMVVNSLRCWGWLLEFPGTIDRIQCEVTVGTSGKVRLGIYADDGTGYPGALLLDSGELTVTTPAVYTATVNLTLKPGFYHIAMLTDTANTFRWNTATYGPSLYGWPATMGNINIEQAWAVAQTYGALPNPFTVGAALTNFNSPQILMRFT